MTKIREAYLKKQKPKTNKNIVEETPVVEPPVVEETSVEEDNTGSEE